MIRSTPTSRSLALLLLAAATVSSGILAAPTTSSRSSALHSTGVEGLQFRSSPEQGSLLDVQRQGVEPYVNLVPRTDTLGLRDARTRTAGTVAMGNLCMIFDSWLNTSHDEQSRITIKTIPGMRVATPTLTLTKTSSIPNPGHKQRAAVLGAQAEPEDRTPCNPVSSTSLLRANAASYMPSSLSPASLGFVRSSRFSDLEGVSSLKGLNSRGVCGVFEEEYGH
ncbi:hypothetical protein F5880DRAFT_1616453 [Lentinula raphanica]|nr:hypothetical protein F5880DRAFT_1616453 [Lentinula raphanica]